MHVKIQDTISDEFFRQHSGVHQVSTEFSMDFNYYQRNTHLTAKYPNHRALEYLILGLASEAGEVAGKYKKVIRDNSGHLDSERRDELISEIGDVLWYIAELATVLGTNMSVIAQNNIDKLASRNARGVIGGSGDNR